MTKAAALLASLLLLGIERAPLPPWVYSGTLPDGVTVTGVAVGSAPASSAVVTLNVTARDRISPIGTGDLAPLVDALVRAGAARSDIALPAYVIGGIYSRVVPVTLTIRNPDERTIARGVVIVGRFLVATPKLWVETASVAITSDACPALAQQLQREAVLQAHANAQRLAQYAQAKLGSVDAVDATRFAPYDSDACTRQYPIVYPSGIMPLQNYLRIPLTSTVAVRYSIAR